MKYNYTFTTWFGIQRYIINSIFLPVLGGPRNIIRNGCGKLHKFVSSTFSWNVLSSFGITINLFFMITHLCIYKI